jgi:hypothetical protein
MQEVVIAKTVIVKMEEMKMLRMKVVVSSLTTQTNVNGVNNA